MPYKYIVAVDSRSFAQAPPEILRILGRLSWATRNVVGAVGDNYLAPNELLALGYAEDMKIGVREAVDGTLNVACAPLY